MSAPPFIYSHHIVDKIQDYLNQRYTAPTEDLKYAKEKLYSILNEHIPRPYQRMLFYTHTFFSPDAATRVEGVRRFDADRAFSLAPHAVIQYMDCNCYPTAWTISGNALVPFEFMNERMLPSNLALRFTPSQYPDMWLALKRLTFHHEMPAAEAFCFRLLDAARYGAFDGVGAFPGHDFSMFLNWIETNEKEMRGLLDECTMPNCSLEELLRTYMRRALHAADRERLALARHATSEHDSGSSILFIW